jgi:hypothetical protein
VPRDKLSDRVSLGDPIRDMVELRRIHEADGTRG